MTGISNYICQLLKTDPILEGIRRFYNHLYVCFVFNFLRDGDIIDNCRLIENVYLEYKHSICLLAFHE